MRWIEKTEIVIAARLESDFASDQEEERRASSIRMLSFFPVISSDYPRSRTKMYRRVGGTIAVTYDRKDPARNFPVGANLWHPAVRC